MFKFLSPFLFGLSIVLCFCAASCNENKPEKISKEEKRERKKSNFRKKPVTGISFEKANEKLKVGDDLSFSVVPLKGAPGIDSVVWMLNGTKQASTNEIPFKFKLSTSNIGTGKHTVSMVSFLSDSTRDRGQESIELFSDVKPKNYGYRIVNTYPHDANAWTQGLLFDNGILYEGTGLKGSSSLRKVDVQTGEITQFRELDATLFGEGIVVFNDDIYQLTYQSRSGKIYDKNTFQHKRDFTYVTEGWGLTTDGKYLIMSDGSNILYFMEPGSFTEVSRIEVYNHEKPVDQLNELEYINGEIYANIWQTDTIVKIDPKSGKILAEIDFSGLREQAVTPQKGDVLNGIAYDETTDRLFVTGKWWNKMFEVRIVEK